jgi:uncharacterized membrane protein YeaQ/YmgE (transglycosylase-associated protein family)
VRPAGSSLGTGYYAVEKSGDEVRLRTALGRLAVKGYYRLSPSLARWLCTRPFARQAINPFSTRLASLVMKTGAQMGVIANIIVGIIGAVLGFWLAGALGIVAVGSRGAWIISILGAVVLIAILKALNFYQ